MDSRVARIRRLSDCYTIDDLRELAYRRLPKAVFHSMEGAGFSELTAERSISAFDDIKLVHKGMIDVSGIDTSINLLGQKLQFPLYCGPTGMTRLYHNDGELAVARAQRGNRYLLRCVDGVSVYARTDRRRNSWPEDPANLCVSRPGPHHEPGRKCEKSKLSCTLRDDRCHAAGPPLP